MPSSKRESNLSEEVILENEGLNWILRHKDMPWCTQKLRNVKNIVWCEQDQASFLKDCKALEERLLEIERDDQYTINRDIQGASLSIGHKDIKEIYCLVKKTPKDALADLNKLVKKIEEALKEPTSPKPKKGQKSKSFVQSLQGEKLATTQNKLVLSSEPSNRVRIAFHNTPYTYVQNELREDSTVVVDAGILFYCFAHEDKKANALGQEIFNLLLTNPKIDAVIVPDYIADVECSGHTQKIKNDKPTLFCVNKKHMCGAEYYSSNLQNALSLAVRRLHSQEPHYNYDITTLEENLIPKWIVWNSVPGQKLEDDYSKAIKRESYYDAQNKGEWLIEELIKTLPYKNVIILSRDNNYLIDNQNIKVKEKNICRANLNKLLFTAISQDFTHWLEISGFKNKAESDLLKEKRPHIVQHLSPFQLYEGILDMMNNELRPETMKDGVEFNDRQVICDNRELWDKITAARINTAPQPLVTNCIKTRNQKDGIAGPA